MNYIGALAIEGRQFDYKTNERLHKALEGKLFEDQKDSIKLTSLVSSVVDRDTQAKIDVVKQRLIKNFGYDEVSATDVLNFVASIFARETSRARHERPAREGPITVELNHTLAELLAKLCVELETDDPQDVMSRALGLLEMVQHTKRQGGRLCFVNARGDVADVASRRSTHEQKIDLDHGRFRQIIRGKIKQNLRKYISQAR